MPTPENALKTPLWMANPDGLYELDRARKPTLRGVARPALLNKDTST